MLTAASRVGSWRAGAFSRIAGCHHHRRHPFLLSWSSASSSSSSTSSPSTSPHPPPIRYSDEYIRNVLRTTKTIAMVGASPNWNRPSYFAMKYLQGKGYRVIPINPVATGQIVLGETVFASLDDVPSSIVIDCVDVFRKASEVPNILEQALKRHTVQTLWLQLGVVNDEAAQIATEAGLRVVMDRCPKIEYSRLYGELGWGGIDSKVISSKRRAVGRTTEGGSQANESVVRTDSSASGSTAAGKEPPSFTGFETKAIHAGAAPCPTTGARATPIYQTTAYVFDSVDHAAQLFNLQAPGNIYTRLTNPTTAVLEQRLAALEGGRGATCTSSGHAAQLLALFPLLEPGARLVSSDKLYGGSLTQFGKTFRKFDWHCDFVNVDDVAQVKDALAHDNVKALFCESLANPGGSVSDLEALASAADEAGVPLIVDNTLATPHLCQPIQHGASLVVHSTTKFLSGHGNAMGGCVIDSGTFQWGRIPGKYPSLSEPEPAYHGIRFEETFGDLAFTTYLHAVGLRDLGTTMAPLNAFLTITGCETLFLRMDRHVQNAQALAEWLDSDPRVAWVSYAGLSTSPYFALGQKYTKGGGSVFTFGLRGGFDAGVQVVERCELFSHLANMGDTRSLILHPASTTHRQLDEGMRVRAGAGDDVIRLSVGLESVEDLIKDLDYALG